ncbi:hypothetical protein WJX79_010144 [Trebouxia sp. C0005]
MADKLFKLPVDIRKSTLLFKLRMPPDLMESANPGCPEQFRAGDIISLGGQCLASSGQNVYSVAQELNLKPYDIVRFTAELNPIYPLQAGSILIVPLPHVNKSE